jgi:hypothetical protein
MLSHHAAPWSNARSIIVLPDQRFALDRCDQVTDVASPGSPGLGKIHRDLASEH